MKISNVSILDNRRLKINFENGEIRIFDVTPYIKGEWMGKLGDPEYFKQVSIEPEFGDTVRWPDGQDIAPHELYELSVA